MCLSRSPFTIITNMLYGELHILKHENGQQQLTNVIAFIAVIEIILPIENPSVLIVYVLSFYSITFPSNGTSTLWQMQLYGRHWV
jgi:hypothetical protein